jgi:hypothetical protein
MTRAVTGVVLPVRGVVVSTVSILVLTPTDCDDYELINLTGDDPITVWRGIVRTLIIIFEARTGGSSAAGDSSAGV